MYERNKTATNSIYIQIFTKKISFHSSKIFEFVCGNVADCHVVLQELFLFQGSDGVYLGESGSAKLPHQLDRRQDRAAQQVPHCKK